MTYSGLTVGALGVCIYTTSKGAPASSLSPFGSTPVTPRRGMDEEEEEDDGWQGFIGGLFDGLGRNNRFVSVRFGNLPACLPTCLPAYLPTYLLLRAPSS